MDQLESVNIQYNLTTLFLTAINDIDFSNPRDKEIVILRFGLNDENKMKTLANDGEQFGVSRELIRQLLNKFFRKLRAKIDVQQKTKMGNCYALYEFILTNTCNDEKLNLSKVTNFTLNSELGIRATVEIITAVLYKESIRKGVKEVIFETINEFTNLSIKLAKLRISIKNRVLNQIILEI